MVLFKMSSGPATNGDEVDEVSENRQNLNAVSVFRNDAAQPQLLMNRF